ncbi:uncharacterized protein LOC115765230 isoform X1 [Drosophila novamexicana]|uniref:uncharacterized protein LOC115765230 isoform X1 n=2 Tax=Drosophila novamexicana TaxID=47314 RepID=UPI0011E5C4FF|nr:uncharacterized protein LOC115765230 isoform X1 [Drosophila novamexicana]
MSGIFNIFGTVYQLAASAANTIFFKRLSDEASVQDDQNQEVNTDNTDEEMSDEQIELPTYRPVRELRRSARLREKKREIHCVCAEVDGQFHKLYELPYYVVSPSADMKQAKRREAARQKMRNMSPGPEA